MLKLLVEFKRLLHFQHMTFEGLSRRLPGFFAYVFSRKRSVKQRKKNAAQCISSNLKATSKNSGTFENTPTNVDFPHSIVFDQALHLYSITSCPNYLQVPIT